MTPTLKLSAALLAGAAFFAAVQPAQAQACTTAAWSSVTAGANAPTAGSVANGVRLYKGACGLRTASTGPSIVEEATNHSAEGASSPFTARFFVYTGLSGGSPVVFRALDQDSGGSSVIDAVYNTATQNFSFTVNGNTVSTANNSAPLNKWVEVLMVYRSGEALTGYTRTTGTPVTNDITANIPGGATAGAATVERVQLGLVAGGSGTGAIHIDEYEASRASPGGRPALSATCRGDASGNGSITAGDRAIITAAINGTFGPERSPDCNEDGNITAGDRACVTALINALATCS
jgi:hypothetical protein